MRAVGILRESSGKQVEGEGLQDQKSAISDYVVELGGEVVAWETVVESASKWDRPQWEEVIDRVIERHYRHEVDALVFHKVDRETRNPLSSVPIIDKALRAGLKVYFAASRLELNPRDPEAVYRYQQEMANAMAYAKAVGGRWHDVHHRRAKKDKHPTNQKLFCFRYENDRRVLDEALKPIGHEAIVLFLKDGLSPVIRWIKSKGINALNSPSALREWLKNPALKGETRVCGRIIHHEGLIDPITWDEVQDILKKNKGRRPSRKGYLPIPFYCECGKRMNADKHNRTRTVTRVYMRCLRCQGKPYFRLDRLLPQVSLATLTYIGEKREFLDDSWVKAQLREQTVAELHNLSKSRKRVEERWKIFYERKADWRGPKNILDEKEDLLVSEQATLEEKENRLLDRLNELPEVEVVDVRKAWDDVVRPYEVHFAPLSPDTPIFDEQKPEDQTLNNLYQEPPSSFYKINNLKPFYLDLRGAPKPEEGCVVPTHSSIQYPNMSGCWDSGVFNAPEQFKSLVPQVDGWIWNLMRDLRAEGFLDRGNIKLRFHLKVNKYRPNKTSL